MRMTHGLAAINVYRDEVVTTFYVNVRLIDHGSRIDFFGDDVIKVKSNTLDKHIGDNYDAHKVKFSDLDKKEMRCLKKGIKSINVTRKRIAKMEHGREELEERFSALNFCVILDVKEVVTPMDVVFADYIKNITIENCSESDMYKHISVFEDNLKTVLLLLRDEDILEEFKPKKPGDNSDKYVAYTLPTVDAQVTIIMSMVEKDGVLVLKNEELIHFMYAHLSRGGLELNCMQASRKLLEKSDHPGRLLFEKALKDIKNMCMEGQVNMNDNVFYLTCVEFFSTIFMYSNNIISRYKSIFDKDIIASNPELAKAELLDIHTTAKSAYVHAVNYQFNEIQKLTDSLQLNPFDMVDKKDTILN